MPAISSRMMNVTAIMRRRILSDSALITGNSRVMRSDSMRNRPMEISTMMMTRAAMSAVRKLPMKLVPPTISAIGRAMSVKLMAAPAAATDSTSAETKKYTSDDEDSMETARSSPRTMMMTRAAMSAVRKLPMKLVPPTISAIGRAMSVKLMAAPAAATDSTSADTKKYTSDDEDSMETARSSP